MLKKCISFWNNLLKWTPQTTRKTSQQHLLTLRHFASIVHMWNVVRIDTYLYNMSISTKTEAFVRLYSKMGKKNIKISASSPSTCQKEEHARTQQQILWSRLHHPNYCRREPPSHSPAFMFTSALPEKLLSALFRNRSLSESWDYGDSHLCQGGYENQFNTG